MSVTEFWPTEANVHHCIRPEAESDWNEVFLAVHQPMRLVRRAFANDSPSTRHVVSENDFFKEFLRKDLPTGTLLMPILGSSGIGKSHLVRWLDVQLKRRSDHERRHVIRVPKSSSLKTVLHHILEGLVGPRYEEIRRQLHSAREQLDVIGAEERIRAEILAEVRRRYNDARQRREFAKTRGGKAEQLDEEWWTHGTPDRGLPALLSDPVTSQMFMTGTGQRAGVIGNLAKHLVTDSMDDTPPRRNFLEEDLIPGDDVDSGSASEPVRAYLRSLERQEGRERRTAVRLLNSVIDSALQPLASPTDASLSEIFFEIRRQLLEEGKELVLLVEDFAVLSGIQGALLDAMIREGVRGDVEACVMRTALAVTAGYDFGRYDTVKTRAIYGWHVDETADGADEEKVVEEIANYVGAYLNAARLGAKKLRQRREEEEDARWPPNFGAENELEPADQKRLDAFGRCQRGWHLFPFNLNAVRQLSDLYLRGSDNRLRLNPRIIINHLLIAVLRNSRSAFMKGEFPNDTFLGEFANQLSATLRAEVKDAEPDSCLRDRHLVMLRFWGDRPNRLADVDLPTGVYESFGLKPLRKPAGTGPSGRNATPPQRALKHDKTSTDTTRTDEADSRPTDIEVERPERQPSFEHPPALRDWETLLNQWNANSVLPQQKANELRTMILAELREAFDWDVLLLRKLTDSEMRGWHGYIYLPHSKGSGYGRENVMCVICSNEQFEDPHVHTSVVLALLGLVRFVHYEKKWDYPDGDLDYARWQNLAERLVGEATAWICTRKYHDLVGDPVPALVDTLLQSARLLNVEAAHKAEYSALVEALFVPVAEPPTPHEEDDWGQLKAEAARQSATLRQELFDRSSVRQGGAEKVHGIDVMRLVEAIRNLRSSDKEPPSLPPTENGTPLHSAFQFARRFRDRLRSAVKKREQQLAGIRQTCQVELGIDFDKPALVACLKNIITEAQRLSVLEADFSAPLLQKLCDEFRAAAVKETLEQFGTATSDDFASQLSALSQIDDNVVALLERFVGTFSRCLKSLESSLTAALAVGGRPVESAKERIHESLLEVDNHLHRLEEAQP